MCGVLRLETKIFLFVKKQIKTFFSLTKSQLLRVIRRKFVTEFLSEAVILIWPCVGKSEENIAFQDGSKSSLEK